MIDDFTVERIIIIAAPSCCGKSRFVSQLRDGNLPTIAERLKMGDVSDWEFKDSFYANDAMISELKQSGGKSLILHWTIPHPSLKLSIRNLLLANGYDKKARLKLIGMARDITVLTLVADPDALVERVGFRKKRVLELRSVGRDSLRVHLKKLRHLRSLAATFQNTDKLVSMYDKWFAFCEQFNVSEYYLVDVNEDPDLKPRDSWKNYVTRWRLPNT